MLFVKTVVNDCCCCRRCRVGKRRWKSRMWKENEPQVPKTKWCQLISRVHIAHENDNIHRVYGMRKRKRKAISTIAVANNSHLSIHFVRLNCIYQRNARKPYNAVYTRWMKKWCFSRLCLVYTRWRQRRQHFIVQYVHIYCAIVHFFLYSL